jgi:predicted heme/steroid binding protein
MGDFPLFGWVLHLKRDNYTASFYNRNMTAPQRTITTQELRSHNGERGSRKWIAYRGTVYDVSDCPRWRRDLHEGLHFSGQDLTSELPEAPHAQEVFERPCVKIVGVYDGIDERT